jgi:hypothetical protein
MTLIDFKFAALATIVAFATLVATLAATGAPLVA